MAGALNPQSAIRNPQSEKFLLLGIFLTSAATLTLEISIIRLLSVAQWHHLAFLVVSMALLGYGASGSFLSSFPSLLGRDPLRFLINGSGLFSLSALLAYLAGNQVPFDLARIAFDRWQVFYLFLLYLIFSLPFFFSGLVISFSLSQWSGSAGKLYFSDLVGASLGCLLVLGLFRTFGGPRTVLFACFLSGLASAIFGRMKRSRGVLPWIWTGFLACLLFWQPPWMELRLSPYKGLSAALRFPGARLLDTQWSAASRVDVLKSPAARTAPGLSLEYLGPLPEQLGLTVDGDHLTAITRLRGDPAGAEELNFLDFLPSSFPYKAFRPRKILVLEPRGGLEVLNALYHGAGDVVVLEPDPVIVKLLKTRYGEFSGNIYDRPGVQLIAEDERSFLHRSRSSFDLIVVPLSESFGASAGGIAGLQEDYRLTAEAFQEYLQALKPGGFLSFSLYLLPPPRAELRVVSTIQRALENNGKNAADHLLSFRTWGTFSLMVKKDPLNRQDGENLKDFCRRMRFDLVYYPGIASEEANLYNRFPRPIYFEAVQNLLGEGENYYSKYPFDLSPATDDRPFFHFFFRWKYWEEVYRMAGEKWQILLEGGFLVPVVFLLALLVSGLFILLPALFKGRGKEEDAGDSPFAWLACFTALGFGFMFVEISLIQKFILFLGHPIYSVSLVIFSLLVSAGLGSRFSLRFHGRSLRQLRILLLFLSGFLFLSAFLYAPILSFFKGHSVFVRWVLTFLLVSIPGFFMGMPFPLAVRLVGSIRPHWVSWGWCANGCASVLGAIVPILIAMNWGFQMVFFLAALCYLFGFLVICKYG
jgi:predicted membrane-bound spermidine synthase